MNSRIKKIVDGLIKKYGTNDPFEIANHLGIITIQEPLGSISGSYYYLKRSKVIFLNTDLSDYEKIVVMAHELGHSILHKRDNCYFMKNKTLLLTSKVEKEANIFAAELLIKDCILNNYEGFSIDQIACAEGLPVELFKFKAFYNN